MHSTKSRVVIGPSNNYAVCMRVCVHFSNPEKLRAVAVKGLRVLTRDVIFRPRNRNRGWGHAARIDLGPSLADSTGPGCTLSDTRQSRLRSLLSLICGPLIVSSRILINRSFFLPPNKGYRWILERVSQRWSPWNLKNEVTVVLARISLSLSLSLSL